MIWLSLTLLGIILLLIVRQSVTRVTQTPWWLLWLVLMLPAFLIGFWTLTQGPKQQIPPPLLVSSFILSSLLYFVLVQRGRIAKSAQAESAESNPGEPATTNNSSEVRPLDKSEESLLQGCFPWSVFYLQQIEYRPQAVLCRGQLRSQPETAYETIRDNVTDQFGDRFLTIFQVGAGNKPFFALVVNPQRQEELAKQLKQPPLNRPGLALGLILLTLLTTTLAGVELADPSVTGQAFTVNPALILTGLPYALPLMAILGIHELGHYLTARFYQIRASLPYFIPVPFSIGTFGAFIQMRSPIPNRKVLFDVGIMGPLAGFVITLPVLIWGLYHSQVVPLPEKPDPLNFNSFNPNFSVLLILISRFIFGSELMTNTGIDLHPAAIAGCLGLVVTALNLMPIGQLDGGHIVHAMYGQRVGAAIGQITRFIVLILSLVQPVLMFWAILLFFMPAIDEPALNDVSELDNRRDLFGLLSLALLLLIILPAPDLLSGLLLTANPAP
jgi:membrane-associated protease RseP (regulator of RpoE activity)